MRWLLTILQVVYPLVLVLAAASRAALPSLFYLIAFFAFLALTPLRSLHRTSAAARDSADVDVAFTPSVYTGTHTPNVPRSSSAVPAGVALSASQSFQSTGLTGTIARSMATQPLTWSLKRGYFVLLALVSGGWLVSQLVSHALMWAGTWRPNGDSDGTAATPNSMLDLLHMLAIAPWPTAKDGLQSLLPDVAVLIASCSYAMMARFTGGERIRVIVAPLCQSDDDAALTSHTWLSDDSELPRRSDSSLTDTVSTAALLRHGFLGCALFLAGILQPSILALPYLLMLMTVIASYAFRRSSDSGRASVDRPGCLSSAVGAGGSRHQRVALSIAAVYIMAHLTLIHIFQFALVRSRILASSPWLGRLGIFFVDATVWNSVAIIQWCFLIALVGCLVAIALKRAYEDDDEEESARSAKRAPAAPSASAMVSPVAPTPITAAPKLRPRDTRQPEETKTSSESLHLHPSSAMLAAAAASSSSLSPSPSTRVSAIRRSFFTQSSFELKSMLQRSFRNHGLILILAVIFVQVMLVHDLFNVGNVAILLACMSLAHVATYRSSLMVLLRVEVAYLIATTIIKYVFFVPDLIASSPIGADHDTLLGVFGLVKHVDGFTASSVSRGTFVCLYLLNAILPAAIIVVYLVAHQTTQELSMVNLFNAASTGDTVLLRRFIAHSPELLTVRDRAHKTILHIAARNGHVATVRLILDYVDVNAQDRRGDTALHLCYQYGYDSLIHILLAAGVHGKGGGPRGGGRHSFNLVNPDLRNKKNQLPKEMKTSRWTKVKRQARKVFLVLEQWFFAGASKLSLLLLFFVSVESVNALHLIFFLFFLVFFSNESVARRCWGMLVAYCAIVFLAIYTFSVVEPLYSFDTTRVDEGTNWIRWVGLFAADSEGSLRAFGQWSKLSIYYGVYALSVIQRLVYRRGSELGLLSAADGVVDSRDDTDSLPTFVDDDQLRRRIASRPHKFERVCIVLLTYVTLVTVAVVDVSLFHLGYLCIFLTALCVHQFSHHAGRMLSGFWFLCIVYSAGVLLLMYAYLLPEFRRWLERNIDSAHFTLYDIGFRATALSDHTSAAGGHEFQKDSILLILLPPTACFVMCVFFLKALWSDIKAKEADRDRASHHRGVDRQRPGRRIGARKYATLQSPLQPVDTPTHRRSSSSPSAAGADERKTDLFDSPPSTRITIDDATVRPSPPPGPQSHRVIYAAPPSLVNFHLLSKSHRKHVSATLNDVFFFLLNVTAHHATHFLTLFVMMKLLFIDDISVVRSVFLLILIVWVPLDGRTIDNALWAPLTLYTVPLIIGKYLFQFPGLVADDALWRWIGFHDFDGKIALNLLTDVAIVAIATVGRVANRTVKKIEKRRLAEEEERRQMQHAAEAEQEWDAADDDEPTPHVVAAPVFHASRLPSHLDTLAEGDEDASISIAASRASEASRRPVRHITTVDYQADASPLPPGVSPVSSSPASPSSLPDVDVLPAYPPHTVSTLTRWTYVSAFVRELWRRLLAVAATFIIDFGIELFLFFLLLTSFARSNLLSIVYVVVYVGIWIYFGGRQAWIHSRTVYISLLVLIGASVVGQYLLLLGMPPGWLQSHSYRWSSWDSIVQEFFVLGDFTKSELMWDGWTYVLACWFLPSWRRERAALDAAGELGSCCRTAGRPVESATATPSSGGSTPRRQSLLSAEDRRVVQSDLPPPPPVMSEEMYVPPALAAQPDTSASWPLQSPPVIRSSAPKHIKAIDLAAAHPAIAHLWSTLLFYSCLLVDKAIFLFIFLIGTSHNNLFSCVYLVFSCWYVLQNHLSDLDTQAFRRMWMRIRHWNFLILVCMVLYQLPWVPDTFLSDANLRWEMTIGFHKFTRPSSDSRFNTAAYLRVFTDPLGTRGALPQILIFLLIEVQLLVLQSDQFQTSIIDYLTDIRRKSAARRRESTATYKEWLLARIQSILLAREELEARFTRVFLKASRMNANYFQDEMVWPQPKPAGWDERVRTIMHEETARDLERRKANPTSDESSDDDTMTKLRAPTLQQGTIAIMPDHPIADSELGDVHQISSPGGTSEFRPVSAAGSPSSSGQSPLPPSVDVVAEEPRSDHSLAEDESNEMHRRESLDARPHGCAHRTLEWCKSRLLPYVDSAFWADFHIDPHTREMVLVDEGKPTLSFGQVVWRVLLSNTQWICFMLYFINLLVNGDLLAIVVPIGILCYAAFERTHVGPGFWLLCMLYTSIVISIKFVFQLYLFCVALDGDSTSNAPHVNRKYIFAPSPYCLSSSASDGYSSDMLLGVRKFQTHTYFTIVLIDMVCLLSIIMHRSIMLARGLWHTNEEEEMARDQRRQVRQAEADAEAAEDQARDDGDALNVPPSPPSRAHPSVPFDSFESELLERSRLQLDRAAERANAEADFKTALYLVHRGESAADAEARKTGGSAEESHSDGFFRRARAGVARLWRRYVPLEVQWYYDTLIPREKFCSVNVHKPGDDFYIYIFLVELIAAIWILICYDLMASTSLNTVSSALSANLFSGSMVGMLFLQILIIILDRVCYLYRSVVGKLLMQYATVAFWFAKIFFDWPVASKSSFTANGYLVFFFMLKLAYFICSGLQIYTGFPSAERTGAQVLTRYPGPVTVILYKIYRALPFVFELRTMLDWMCSVSSLDLWDSQRLAEIHGSLYLARCDILYRREHPRGHRRDLVEKFCIGVLLFVLLLVIIFGPLLLFSTANPVSQANPVASASISISLVGSEGEYPLVGISSYTLEQISQSTYVQLSNDDLLQDGDSIDAIQLVRMAPFSDQTWTISPPALTRLTESLVDPAQTMEIKFAYAFTRTSGPVASKTISSQVTVQLDQGVMSQLARIINQTGAATATRSDRPLATVPVMINHVDVPPRNSDVHVFHYHRPSRVAASDSVGVSSSSSSSSSVSIPGVVPMFLRLPATTDPIELTNASNRTQITLEMDVSHQGVVRWWFVSEAIDDTQASIQFITVSNRIFAGLLSNLSLSIVAVYVTILFTVGQFVRLAFGNQVARIPVEDLPNANELAQIVEGVYVARQKKQLAKEEILYRRVLKIYRTPALMLMLTAREDSEEEKRQSQTQTDTTGGDEPAHGKQSHAHEAKTNTRGLRARHTHAARDSEPAPHDEDRKDRS